MDLHGQILYNAEGFFSKGDDTKMEVLTCDVCGGKLIGRPGGVFECGSCGLNYSTEWVKDKLQKENYKNAAHTVKKANAEKLVEQGSQALQRGEWTLAEKHFRDALGLDSENAEGYLGLALAGWKIPALEDKYEWVTLSREDINYRRALQYANVPTLKRILAARQAAQEKFDAEKKRMERVHSEKALWLLPKREKIAPAQHLLSAYNERSVGVRLDGTVKALGMDRREISLIKGWIDITSAAAGGTHTVGLKSDGTVVTTGETCNEICDITEWKNVVEIAAGCSHTVGLMSDGTVSALCRNEHIMDGQCDVWDWHHIIAIAAGSRHTVGLRANGSTVAVGDNKYGQCDVWRWTRIVSISAGHTHTVGLRSDGTVLSAGSYGTEKCDLSGWTDIIAVSAGAFHTVGLKADGTVVAQGKRDNGQCKVDGWKDIVAVAAGRSHTLGLRSDGTVVVTGFRGRQNQHSAIIHGVDNWKLFSSLDVLEQERHQLMEARAAVEIALREESESNRSGFNYDGEMLRTELRNIDGIF